MTAITKKGYRDKKLGLAALLVVSLMAGCATGPSKFSYPTVTINNNPYFVLVQMCEQETVSWDYDPLSQVVILKKQDRDIKLLIGSKTVMVDNVFQELATAPIIQDGVIYAPLDLRNYIEKRVCQQPLKPILKGSAYLRSVETIVLDAGHGGRDPGAIGKQGLREKAVVLDMVKKIKEELQNCGLKVYFTRSEDEFISLQDRPRLANEKKADLFISIHANANRARWIEGFEVYYLTENVDDNARALAAAENFPYGLPNQGFLNTSLPLKAILWDMIFTENRRESIELAQCISNSVAKTMNLKLLGVKGAPFVVLKGAQMPAVLVEIGYLSNGDGEKKLRDSEYRKKMAQAIAQGILNFKNYCKGSWTSP